MRRYTPKSFRTADALLVFPQWIKLDVLIIFVASTTQVSFRLTWIPLLYAAGRSAQVEIHRQELWWSNSAMSHAERRVRDRLVFQAEEEAGAARVALPPRAPSQLVVNTPCLLQATPHPHQTPHPTSAYQREGKPRRKSLMSRRPPLTNMQPAEGTALPKTSMGTGVPPVSGHAHGEQHCVAAQDHGREE